MYDRSESQRPKFVKANDDDPESKMIQTRMGCTVSEFMRFSRVDGYRSGVFVWPKQTPNELVDYNEIIYQHGADDDSWLVRYNALCLPDENGEDEEPTTMLNVKQLNNINNAKVSRISDNDTGLSAETRKTLEADLQLSDSEPSDSETAIHQHDDAHHPSTVPAVVDFASASQHRLYPAASTPPATNKPGDDAEYIERLVSEASYLRRAIPSHAMVSPLSVMPPPPPADEDDEDLDYPPTFDKPGPIESSRVEKSSLVSADQDDTHTSVQQQRQQQLSSEKPLSSVKSTAQQSKPAAEPPPAGDRCLTAALPPHDPDAFAQQLLSDSHQALAKRHSCMVTPLSPPRLPPPPPHSAQPLVQVTEAPSPRVAVKTRPQKPSSPPTQPTTPRRQKAKRKISAVPDAPLPTRPDSKLVVPGQTKVPPSTGDQRPLVDTQPVFRQMPLASNETALPSSKSIGWIFPSLNTRKIRNALKYDFKALCDSHAALIDSCRSSLKSGGKPEQPLTCTVILPPSFYSTPATTTTTTKAPPDDKVVYTSTMTSPLAVLMTNMGIQCDLKGSSSRAAVVSKPLGAVPPIQRDPSIELTSAPSSATSSLNPLAALISSAANGTHALPVGLLVEALTLVGEHQHRVVAAEESRIALSTSSSEIEQAGHLKEAYTESWSCLVKAIKLETEDRLQLGLRLASLHAYPVALVQSVGRLATAAHLFLSVEQDFASARSACTDAVEAVDSCSRRLRNVEAKLQHRRGSRRPETAWMTLWHYLLAKLKAVLLHTIYRINMASICAEFGVGPTGAAACVGDPANVSTTSSDNTSDSSWPQELSKDASKLSPAIISRVFETLKFVHEANSIWQHAERHLAPQVPSVLPSAASSSSLTLHTSSRAVDSDIALFSNGVLLSGPNADLGSVMLCISGTVKLHSRLIANLKLLSNGANQAEQQSIASLDSTTELLPDSDSQSRSRKRPSQQQQQPRDPSSTPSSSVSSLGPQQQSVSGNKVKQSHNASPKLRHDQPSDQKRSKLPFDSSIGTESVEPKKRKERSSESLLPKSSSVTSLKIATKSKNERSSGSSSGNPSPLEPQRKPTAPSKTGLKRSATERPFIASQPKPTKAFKAPKGSPPRSNTTSPVAPRSSSLPRSKQQQQQARRQPPADLFAPVNVVPIKTSTSMAKKRPVTSSSSSSILFAPDTAADSKSSRQPTSTSSSSKHQRIR